MRLTSVLVIALFVLLLSTVNAAIYSSSDPVTFLTDSNFDKTVLKSDQVWVVKFYMDGCGHCVSFGPEYLKAAKALKGIVHFGVLDGKANRQISSKYSIQGFPTVKVFAADKATPIDFTGARDAKTLSQFAITQVRETVSTRLNGGKPKDSKPSSSAGSPSTGGKAIELTASNFKSQVLQSEYAWIVTFFAPWCGHCKAMKPDFEAAAKQFSPDSTVRFGLVDCTVHESTCRDYQVKGYPTIKSFSNGKPADYNGGRSTSDFVTYMKNQGAKSKPVPKPVELLDQAQLDKCLNEQICIFASLPDIRDTTVEERKKYLQVLTDVAAKAKQHNIQWVYSFARNHRELENALKMGENGFPAVVLINKAKSLYSPFYRALTVEALYEWANTAGSGRVSNAQNYKELPPIQTVPAWDGKAAPKDEL